MRGYGQDLQKPAHPRILTALRRPLPPARNNGFFPPTVPILLEGRAAFPTRQARAVVAGSLPTLPPSEQKTL